MGTTDEYGYNEAQVEQVKSSFEQISANLMNTVGEIGDATNSSASIWESPSYAQFKVKLDDFEVNAEALGRCVNAFNEWLCGLQSQYDRVDNNATEMWGSF